VAIVVCWPDVAGVPAVVCCNALLNEGARDNNMTLITHVHDAMTSAYHALLLLSF
jgi:hypothetical protein